jgi:hypothetical protein
LKLRVRVAPEAEADIAQALDWYQQAQQGLGTDFSMRSGTLWSELQRIQKCSPWFTGTSAVSCCWSQGKDENEALDNIKDAIQAYLSVAEEQLQGAEVRDQRPIR